MRFVPVRAAVLGALFAAIITLPGLGNGTLWDNSETVYGEAGREVLLTHDWVVMHVNGIPWFVQPPLFFWIAAVCAKIFGVTAFAMRLPAALATIAMGGALGYATARVAGTRAGTVAAIVLSTSLMQAIVGRLAIMDALLDLCVVIATLCWFRAFEPHAHRNDVRRRTVAFLSGTVALALGTLAKGPVAPVIVVLVLAVWLVWERRSDAPVALPSWRTFAAAAGLYVLIVAPWFVLEAIRVGPDAFRELIGHYTIGRYTGVIENQSGPWWYYVPVLILGFFPWIAFVPAAAAHAIDSARTRAGSLERLALAWAVVPLVFFSFAETKLPNYIALMLPALAIVVALWFERVFDTVDRRAAIASALSIPLLIGALGIAIVVFIKNNHLESTTAIVVPQARNSRRGHADRIAGHRRRDRDARLELDRALRARRDVGCARAVHRVRGRAGGGDVQTDPRHRARHRGAARTGCGGCGPRRRGQLRTDLLYRARRAVAGRSALRRHGRDLRRARRVSRHARGRCRRTDPAGRRPAPERLGTRPLERRRLAPSHGVRLLKVPAARCHTIRAWTP